MHHYKLKKHIFKTLSSILYIYKLIIVLVNYSVNYKYYAACSAIFSMNVGYHSGTSYFVDYFSELLCYGCHTFSKIKRNHKFEIVFLFWKIVTSGFCLFVAFNYSNCNFAFLLVYFITQF